VLTAVAFTLAVATPALASADATRADDPTAATGSLGVRLLDAPVSAVDDPRAKLYVVDHLNPGAVIHRRIEVSNSSAATAHVSLYAAAASIANGSFLGAAGHSANDLSTWTAVDPGVSDIPAAGRATATVTVAVPTDASPGEQYGVVWAEVRAAPGAAGGVTQVSRVGIRLYLSIGPGGPPAANFTIGSLTARRSADGAPMVLAAVHNTGGRALDMSGNLQLLQGPGGLSAGPFAADLGTTLAIADTETVTIVLGKAVPLGPWDAQVVLRSGLLERRARARITFPSATAVVSDSDQPGWLYPAGAGVLVLLGIAGRFIVIRRRRPKVLGHAPRALPPAA
jgi:hypothetical protein